MFSKIKISNIVLFAFVFLLYMSSLNNVGSSIHYIGLASLLAALTIPIVFFIFHLAKTKESLKIHAKLISASFLFFTILAAGVLNNQSIQGITTFIQFILLFGCTLALSTINWDKEKIKILGICTSVFVVLNFLLWATTGFQPFFKGLLNSSNLVGAYMFCCFFFILLARSQSKKKYFYNIMALIALLVMYGTSTRSTMVALAIGFITYLLWNLISKHRSYFVSFILLVFTSLLSFVFLYPLLPYWKYFNQLELWILKYSGKSIMSGREYIWSALIAKINEFPILGHGTGTLPAEVTNATNSSHNLYLQIALQNGYLGLAAFLLLIFAIWMVFWNVRKDKSIRLISSFFVAILVYQSFEITLTQNFLSIAILQWLLIAIGISYFIFKNKTIPSSPV